MIYPKLALCRTMLVSVDVGGTFTDIVIVDGTVEHFKLPSTPEDPSRAVIEGFPAGADEFIHGTTVATNAFLEGKGVPTAFITNVGMEDILFIGRQTRPELYDLVVKKPKPPLQMDDLYGVDCRIDAHGREIRCVDEHEIEELAKELKGKGHSAAICLLHSYRDGSHEDSIGRILKRYDIPCSLSHRVSNEFREYERGMTTLLDAYLGPVVRDYFLRLKKGTGIEPMVMKSSGGLEPASKVNPIDTFYSGPAGGVAGGEYIAQLLGMDNLIPFDMGGTSADMSTIVDGKISWKDKGRIGSFPVQSRMVDLETVGAGGGSIAWIDEGGALRVGPKSSGADPGPACYGRGGEEPTVTDALLLAGYIDKDYFLGGRMELDVENANRATRELSDELELSQRDTIIGIIRVANSSMVRCMKKITVEKGLSPSEFSILAFGGAGPLHAAYLADELGIKRVIVPPMAGVFSALGMLTGDIVYESSRTLLCSIDEKEKIRNVVHELGSKIGGVSRVYLSLRYKGQSHHINLPMRSDMRQRFHEEHRSVYGYSDHGAEIEAVNVRVEKRSERDFKGFPAGRGEVCSPREKVCLFPEGERSCKVFLRDNLVPGSEEDGPAIIGSVDSTALVPPGWSFKTDEHNILHMEAKR